MHYKNPHAILVVIYAQSTGRVLMLQRQDDPDFWQSVTGSLALDETPRQAALREVREETGFDIIAQNLAFYDVDHCVEFEIFPHFRYKYAPNITHCREHWFVLALRDEQTPNLSEHLAFQWLEPFEAAQLSKSPNNAEAIVKFADFWQKDPACSTI